MGGGGGSHWHKGEQLRWQLPLFPQPLIVWEGCLSWGPTLLCQSAMRGRVVWKGSQSAARVRAVWGPALSGKGQGPPGQSAGSSPRQAHENCDRQPEWPVIFPLSWRALNRSLYMKNEPRVKCMTFEAMLYNYGTLGQIRASPGREPGAKLQNARDWDLRSGLGLQDTELCILLGSSTKPNLLVSNIYFTDALYQSSHWLSYQIMNTYDYTSIVEKKDTLINDHFMFEEQPK